MTKEKQIEEMAFNLIMATSPLGVKDLTKQFDYKTVATDLYEQYGWRKSSEVAREIFEEIERTARAAIILLKFEKDEKIRNAKTECYTDLIGYIAELKNKYTEEK